jgi:uncharacterized repeat protein (TIGR04076 family)
MVRVKITVLKKCWFEDLAEAYLTDGKEAGACPLLGEGDTFVYEGGAVMPEGFCPWAWIDVYRSLSTLSSSPTGNHWYRYPDKRITCCTDGVRPVVFALEALPGEIDE